MTADTELRELLAAATPRPWAHDGMGGVRSTALIATGPKWLTKLGGCVVNRPSRPVDGLTPEANAELIVAAVNALPGLLDRAERAEAEVARLRDTMRRSPQMSRVWQAEEETERLREGIKALADELHRVDVAMLAGGAGPASMSVRDTVRRLRSLLQEGE